MDSGFWFSVILPDIAAGRPYPPAQPQSELCIATLSVNAARVWPGPIEKFPAFQNFL